MKKSVWLPALIAPVVVVGVVAAPALANAANTPIAGRNPSAADVIASVAKSSDAQYSGKLSQSSDLGLPELPSGSGGSSLEGNASDALDLATSSHDARVYVDGPDRARVQLTQQLAEQDLIVNGSTVWTWDSKQREATHVTLPSRADAKAMHDSTATPSEVAQKAIDAMTPSTTVSKPTSTKVAGHDAWQVVLTPKSSDTLVGSVRLAVDKQTGLPLSAAIDAKGQKTPAFQVGFTKLQYGDQDQKLFDFTPPSGAKVTTKGLSDAADHAKGDHRGWTASGDHAPSVVGTGWDAVAELPAGTVSTKDLGADGSQLLDQLTKPVDGGRAVQTSLVSVYLADDGRVLVGAVPVSTLVAAAAK
jgi:outer membrane lipoprotein-sorting protein